MKAVIMAGGEGTRLRPLTCDLPKPLVPLCGKPVICYILDLLKAHGCEQAAVTLLYLGHQIEKRFESGNYEGIPLKFCYEDKPLGTAGSVKHAVPASEEPVVIISGDAMCDFDLTAAMRFHQEKQAAATLIVKQVTDPREYGLVNCTADGRISGFLEKPPLSHCVGNLANTGVYILSPEALAMIPSGENIDFGADLFPLMLKKQMPLYAYEDAGYWCDIGDLGTYLSCQQDMLEGRVRCRIAAEETNGIYSKTALSALHCRIIPPVYIGEGVTVGEDVVIGSGSVIGDHVTIGSHARIHASVIHDCACIGEGTSCNSAILCRKARMLRHSAAFEHSVMGSESVLGEESILSDGARLWIKKQTDSRITVNGDVKYGFARDIVIDDDGITGETNVTMTPELMTKIGASAGSLKAGCKVGVSCSRTRSGNVLKQALSAGLLSAGTTVLDFGETIGAEYDYCLRKSGADFGVYVDSGIVTRVVLTERGGIPMMRKLERKLEGLLNRGEYKKAAWNTFGVLLDLSGLKKLYQAELINNCSGDLQGMTVQVKSSDSVGKELLCDTLKKLGCHVRGEMSLILSPDGRQLSAYTPQTGYLFPDKILCLVCLAEFLDGRDVVVPYEAPFVIEQLARRYGRQALRYYASPCDTKDTAAREGLRELSLRDGFALALKLLSFLKKRGINLAEAYALLPEFSTANRLVSLHTAPAEVMRQFEAEGNAGEGILINRPDGKVLLRPLKSGKGIMLFAESLRSETAAELCDFMEKDIRGKERQNANREKRQ